MAQAYCLRYFSCCDIRSARWIAAVVVAVDTEVGIAAIAEPAARVV